MRRRGNVGDRELCCTRTITIIFLRPVALACSDGSLT